MAAKKEELVCSKAEVGCRQWNRWANDRTSQVGTLSFSRVLSKEVHEQYFGKGETFIWNPTGEKLAKHALKALCMVGQNFTLSQSGPNTWQLNYCEFPPNNP